MTQPKEEINLMSSPSKNDPQNRININIQRYQEKRQKQTNIFQIGGQNN